MGIGAGYWAAHIFAEFTQTNFIVAGNKKEDIFLTLRIYADKQYDYDQNIYLFAY